MDYVILIVFSDLNNSMVLNVAKSFPSKMNQTVVRVINTKHSKLLLLSEKKKTKSSCLGNSLMGCHMVAMESIPRCQWNGHASR